MKKIIFICLALSMTGCIQSNNAVQSINTKVAQSANSTELKFSFKIKAVDIQHVKSVDAYIVSDKTNPLGSIAVGTTLKQVDVDATGTVNFTFTVSAVGTYYAALQAYDNTIASGTRNNITALNTVVTTGTGNVAKRFAFSTNSVAYNGSLTYSTGTALNVAIDLEYNNLPVNIIPSAGSPLPTNSINVG